MIPLTNHDSSEVIVRSLESTQIIKSSFSLVHVLGKLLLALESSHASSSSSRPWCTLPAEIPTSTEVLPSVVRTAWWASNLGKPEKKTHSNAIYVTMISLLHLRIWIIYTQYSQVIPTMGTPNALVIPMVPNPNFKQQRCPATAWMSKNSIWPWASIRTWFSSCFELERSWTYFILFYIISCLQPLQK